MTQNTAVKPANQNSVKTAASTQSQVTRKFATDALIGSGWVNGNFINITFDNNTNLAALAAEVAAGKKLSLIPRKTVMTGKDGREYPACKYVLALRSEQQA